MIARLDAFQQRHRLVGFPLAVVFKYFDDQGPYLAATLTYYAFIAIFPLLLIASSLLGFLLQGNEELQAELLDSALSRFPIVGTQLGRPEGLGLDQTAVSEAQDRAVLGQRVGDLAVGDQAASAGRLIRGLSLNAPIVSSVI